MGCSFFSHNEKQWNFDLVKGLSVITLMQIYNEKERDGQRKVKSVQLEEKKSTWQCLVGVKSCDRREKV